MTNWIAIVMYMLRELARNSVVRDFATFTQRDAMQRADCARLMVDSEVSRFLSEFNARFGNDHRAIAVHLLAQATKEQIREIGTTPLPLGYTLVTKKKRARRTPKPLTLKNAGPRKLSAFERYHADRTLFRDETEVDSQTFRPGYDGEGAVNARTGRCAGSWGKPAKVRSPFRVIVKYVNGVACVGLPTK